MRRPRRGSGARPAPAPHPQPRRRPLAEAQLAAGADPERPSHAQTPLYLAAWHDVPAAIDPILARCPDPVAALETRCDMDWTALFAAVWMGHAACTARLLQRGARRDLTDEHGRTLADAAARSGLVLPP